MGPAPRIVTLAPSNTEIIASLGLAHLLVGIDDHSDWPDGIMDLPRVGPDLGIKLDVVASLQPDLVVASLSVPGMERIVAELEAMGLPHIVLNPQSLDEIWQDLRTVGDVLGVPERAEEAIASLKARVERIRHEAAGIRPRRLYWEWWPRPIYTPGGKNWLTEISRICGCDNIFSDYDVANVRVDDHMEVVRRRPDDIMLAWTGVKRPQVEHVYRREGWEAMPAVRNRRVFVLEEGLFNRPSPRLIDGLEQLWGIVQSGE